MEEKLIEQPNLGTDENSFEETHESTNQEGSMFGKFKDAKTLLEAYNSLQAEFTRKSQKLSDFQKELNKTAVFSEKTLDDVLNSSTDKDKYKKEIEEILASNEDIANLPNKYQIAFKIITESERKSAEKLNSQDFIDKYIESNSNINNQIISKYLSTLNNISTAPNVISGNANSIYFSPQEKQPKTLKDAGEIFSKMLK